MFFNSAVATKVQEITAYAVKKGYTEDEIIEHLRNLNHQLCLEEIQKIAQLYDFNQRQN